jgi:hypothetical protein
MYYELKERKDNTAHVAMDIISDKDTGTLLICHDDGVISFKQLDEKDVLRYYDDVTGGSVNVKWIDSLFPNINLDGLRDYIIEYASDAKVGRKMITTKYYKPNNPDEGLIAYRKKVIDDKSANEVLLLAGTKDDYFFEWQDYSLMADLFHEVTDPDEIEQADEILDVVELETLIRFIKAI